MANVMLTQKGWDFVTSAHDDGIFINLKYFVPVYDDRIDSTIRDAAVLSSYTQIRDIELTSPIGEIIWNSSTYNLHTTDKYIISANTFGSNVMNDSYQNSITYTNLSGTTPLSNQISADSWSVSGADGLYDWGTDNGIAVNGSNNRPTSTKSDFWRVTDYYPVYDTSAEEEIRGSFKCILDNTVGSYKFNKVALYAAAVDGTVERDEIVFFGEAYIRTPAVVSNLSQGFDRFEFDIQLQISGTSASFEDIFYSSSADYWSHSPGGLYYSGRIGVGEFVDGQNAISATIHARKARDESGDVDYTVPIVKLAYDNSAFCNIDIVEYSDEFQAYKYGIISGSNLDYIDIRPYVNTDLLTGNTVNVTNITATNNRLTNVSATNISATNITAINNRLTNVSATNISATNVTATNETVTGLTATNISVPDGTGNSGYKINVEYDGLNYNLSISGYDNSEDGGIFLHNDVYASNSYMEVNDIATNDLIVTSDFIATAANSRIGNVSATNISATNITATNGTITATNSTVTNSFIATAANSRMGNVSASNISATTATILTATSNKIEVNAIDINGGNLAITGTGTNDATFGCHVYVTSDYSLTATTMTATNLNTTNLISGPARFSGNISATQVSGLTFSANNGYYERNRTTAMGEWISADTLTTSLSPISGARFLYTTVGDTVFFKMSFLGPSYDKSQFTITLPIASTETVGNIICDGYVQDGPYITLLGNLYDSNTVTMTCMSTTATFTNTYAMYIKGFYSIA